MKLTRLRDILIKEISLVRKPAQEGAVISVIKSDDQSVVVAKAPLSSSARGDLPKSAFLYTDANGVGHLPYRHADGTLDLNHLRNAAARLDQTTSVPASSREKIRAKIERLLGENTKEKAMATKGKNPQYGKPSEMDNEDDEGTEDTGADQSPAGTPPGKKTGQAAKKAAEENQMEIDELKKQLEASKSYGQLTDAEKAFYHRLSVDDQKTFVAKSATDRAAEMKPVYESKRTGMSFNKADDPKIIAVSKAADEDYARMQAQVEKSDNAVLHARVEKELGHLAGDVDARAALLKAAEGIADEKQREAAVAALKAADAVAKMAFERQGARAIKPGGGDPQSRLDAAVQKHATDNKVSIEKAYDAFVTTPEGAKLYGEAERARMAHTPS